MSKKNIVLAFVADQPIVLEGLRSLFSKESKHYNLLCFGNGNALLSFLENNMIDVILLDVLLPDLSGPEVCKTIKGLYPNITVIGMSNQPEQIVIQEMLQYGSSGFILKDSSLSEILCSIELALNDKVVLSPEVKKILEGPLTGATQLPPLTKRDRQLVQLLKKGKTTKEIAEDLHLSKLTIDTYRKNLLRKFDSKNTAELLMLLVDNKVI